MTTMNLESLAERLPDAARDLKLNLGNVLGENSLNPTQRWGTAVASAYACRNADLRDAIVAGARAAGVADATLEDARAAAALMGMNNVYYRFRHYIAKESYQTKRAGLRMNRIVKPAADKVEFELYCLAVSAINGCEACVRSHEDVVIKGGMSDDQVHDAVRIAAVLHGVAVALETV